MSGTLSQCGNRPSGFLRLPFEIRETPLLTGLRQLCLVAEQPLEAGAYFDGSTLEQETQIWIEWLGPILRYLAKNMSKTTTVSVDDNDVVETGELMQKCLSPGYNKVQTVTGDEIFLRSQFLEESD
ncbi:hypothetical protein P152DRAFT_458624 [Eremomyces bilateralis CBS 781.70]|uniref:Uncharacterized protein n=1 Tax=Eremomyces bilateralis CBS 781.70 TaxID=1392243 RepID=A0A6G1G2G2_9PEZI|nr:uncharacterized protein P152DRAFT_458624 [Eremomyces bilateralis CBS 781.70]KAF1812233.1 hypothetical protein P152DRAFT_458624 [Eremomyces bilateralis CBS 781.70]